MIDVLFVSLPFGPLFAPSLGVSLLQPQVRRAGLTCEIAYLTFDYAERIGQDLYYKLASDARGSLRDFTGEWIFSDALFDRPPDAGRDCRYVHEILIERRAWPDRTLARAMSRERIDAFLAAKRQVPAFLDACVDRILQAEPRILGFTSVFQQHVASLALAKRVKARRPETVIVFGGANAEGVMGAETLRQFPFVDAIVSGEADRVFPEMATRIVAGKSYSDLVGVISQSTVRQAFAFGRFPTAPNVTDLDALPYPDYTDFFSQFTRTRFSGRWEPSVFVETSRGCWWGERMHCTFCGLNGETMAFRAKSAERALAEFVHLAEAYPDCDIQVVDNILDLKYFKTLLPALAEKNLEIELFYETKSNLKKEQVRLLGDAGVKTIQPGIESFSDVVLKLMKKGVTGLHNIQLLKWCKEFGVEPAWNLLWGFPGEPPDEYRRMAEWMPRLGHLPGPSAGSAIRLDRFSPNFFDAEKLGFTNVRPLPPYEFIYDLPAPARHNLAYYFAYDYTQPIDVAAYIRPVARRMHAWRKSWQRSELVSIDLDGTMMLLDTRPGSRTPLTVLSGLDREIYVACDEIADPQRVAAALRASGTAAATAAHVSERLALMVDRRIVINDGLRHLSLAVPLGHYVSTGRAALGLLELLSHLSGRRDGRIRIPLDRADYQLDSQPRRGAAVRTTRTRAAGEGSRSKSIRFSRADFSIGPRRELRVRRRWTAN